MQTLKKLVIAVVVLALFSVFLINAGSMPAVVNFAREALGVQVGDAIEDFGDTSKDVVDGNYEPNANVDWDGWFSGSPDEAAEAAESTDTTTTERIPPYDRDSFGSAWADVDGNGCDTRNDILARDLTNITKEGDCKVLTGTLADQYTGETINFTRGTKTSSAVQIDHVVALSQAHQMGAWSWNDEKKMAFANDPMNLIASDGPENASKSDKGPAEWSPPNKAFQCDYLMNYMVVVDKYDLTLQSADKDFITAELPKCS